MAGSGERIGAVQERLAEPDDVASWVEAWRLTVQAGSDATGTLCREWRRYPDRLLAVLREQLSAGADIAAEIWRTRWQKHWPQASDSDTTVIPLTALTAAGRVAVAQRAGRVDRKAQRALLKGLGCQHRVVDAGLACSRPECEASAVATDVVAILAGEGRFLARSPQERAQRSVWVPWTRDNQSGLARLVVEVIRDGRGACYPDPAQHLFTPWHVSFRTTVKTAWEWAREGQGKLDCDLRWRLEGLSPEKVKGDSAGAALAVAFRAVLDEALVDEGIVIAAALKGDRLKSFSPETIKRKAKTLLPRHPDKAKLPDLGALVLVAPPNATHLRSVLARHPTVHIVPVDTLDAAVAAAGGWRGAACRWTAERCRTLDVLGHPVGAMGTDYQVPVVASDGHNANPDALIVYLAQKHHGMLLAPPGGGKTTLARYLCWLLTEGGRFWNERRLIPVYVDLPDWKMSGELSFAAYLGRALNNHYVRPTAGHWLRWIRNGDVLILLDGLDEIDPADVAFFKEVRHVLLESKQTPVFVTCRESEENRYPGLQDLPRITWDPLVHRQQRAMVDCLVASMGAHHVSSAILDAIRTGPLRQLSSNPLMLSVLCWVVANNQHYPLPAARGQLLQETIKTLLRRPRSSNDRRAPNFDGMLPVTQLGVLKCATLHLYLARRGNKRFSETDLIKALSSAASREGLVRSRGDLAEDFYRVLTGRSGLLRATETGYAFVHPILHEYLASSAVVDACRARWTGATVFWPSRGRVSVSDVIEEVFGGFPGAEEFLVLLAGDLPDPSPMLEQLLDTSTLRAAALARRRVSLRAAEEALNAAVPAGDTRRVARAQLGAAQALNLLQRFQDAAPRAELAADAARRAHDPATLARALSLRASIEMENPGFGTLEVFDQALTSLGNAHGRAALDIWWMKATVALRLEAWDAFSGAIDQLELLMRGRLHRKRLPFLWQLKGEAFAQQRRWTEAQEHLTKALRAFEGTGGPVLKCAAVGWLGLVACHMGRMAEGRRMVDEALHTERDELDSLEGVAKWLRWLGWMFLNCGENVRARETLLMALWLYEELGHTDRKKVQVLLGRVLSSHPLPSSDTLMTETDYGKFVFPFQKYSHNPVLVPGSASWEDFAVYNPAAWANEDTVFLLYRAQGRETLGPNTRTSTIGLATSADGTTFTRSAYPVLEATESYEERGGCEDPRMVRVDDLFLLTYTAYDGKTARLALATSRDPDLRRWEKHGPLFPDLEWTKSGAILPHRVQGVYWMYFGDKVIRAATSHDLLHWRVLDEPVLQPREGRFDDFLVEPGPPPLLTDRGILLFYNSAKRTQNGPLRYAMGRVFFDKDDPRRVVRRSVFPLLSPNTISEQNGQVPHVVFATGLVHFQRRWLLYYGMADARVGMAVSDWPLLGPGSEPI